MGLPSADCSATPNHAVRWAAQPSTNRLDCNLLDTAADLPQLADRHLLQPHDPPVRPSRILPSSPGGRMDTIIQRRVPAGRQPREDGAGSGLTRRPSAPVSCCYIGARLIHTPGRRVGHDQADLVEPVADVVGTQVTKRDCGLVVHAFLDAAKDTLARGDHIEIRDFGTFKVRHRRARTARNPRTGKPVEVPAPASRRSSSPRHSSAPGRLRGTSSRRRACALVLGRDRSGMVSHSGNFPEIEAVFPPVRYGGV
ncbi:HU family DNA-binding protein [Candidatus Palauibacter sp.]|uniref:HU family DNA-binding protein n=1 Tax=Candidatus Palauibacter sp. TaxID=3101350 RepID=UPI003B516461